MTNLEDSPDIEIDTLKLKLNEKDVYTTFEELYFHSLLIDEKTKLIQ